MTAKKSPTMLRLEAYIEGIKSNLAYAPGPILEDAHLALHDAISASDSEEVAQRLIDDYFAERPHLMKTKVLIPPDMLEAAFGERATLKAQGDIFKRYGQDAAAEAARNWKTSLGSTKPGRDPDAGAPAASAKKQSEAETPSKNPWHPKFPAKTQEERLAAQASIIRGLGSKVAANFARSAGVTLSGAPLK